MGEAKMLAANEAIAGEELKVVPVDGGRVELTRLDEAGTQIGQSLIAREADLVALPLDKPGWREWADKVAVGIIETEQYLFMHRFQIMAGVVALGGIGAVVRGINGLIDAQAINWITHIDPIHLPSLRPVFDSLWLGDLKTAAEQAGLWGYNSLNALADSTLAKADRYTTYSVFDNLHKVSLSPTESTPGCAGVDMVMWDPRGKFDEVSVQGVADGNAGIKHTFDASGFWPTHNEFCLEPGTDQIIFSADQVGTAETPINSVQFTPLAAGE